MLNWEIGGKKNPKKGVVVRMNLICLEAISSSFGCCAMAAGFDGSRQKRKYVPLPDHYPVGNFAHSIFFGLKFIWLDKIWHHRQWAADNQSLKSELDIYGRKDTYIWFAEVCWKRQISSMRVEKENEMRGEISEPSKIRNWITSCRGTKGIKFN